MVIRRKTKSHLKVPSDADQVAKYFQDNYESTDSVIDTSFLPTYHNPHSLFNNTAIKPKDIRLALKKNQVNQCPWTRWHKLPASKKCPAIQHILATLFIRILKTGDMPSSWQEGYVSLIYKAGDSRESSKLLTNCLDIYHL